MIITPETLVDKELSTCNELLQLDIRLHVRKPSWSFDQTKEYLTQLDSQCYSKISLHQHHELVNEMDLGGIHWKSNQQVISSGQMINSKSFHSFKEIRDESHTLAYGFLSPIYDSISKDNYQSQFDLNELKEEFEKGTPFPIYALGGVTLDDLATLRAIGFKGAVLLGSFWIDGEYERHLNLLKHITHGNC
ncbi:thiamine phosphate synthase [Reichenbachiella agarivorans]|uniref:Thiamine phosphate synthase n=1 Tax=Reichenbachiella agarivorans TaxID=2979464 RepID=A0ABY6CUI8_9BACT|nr:thiamine phosphate synthase [Reichenbachiella agarivorans]UXP34192.1 thiamine phosphate synthase [Reichenbachiella agarivorans]